jgi:hypothetical protein
MKLNRVLIYVGVLVALAGYIFIVEVKIKGTKKAAEEKAEQIVEIAKDDIESFELNSKEHGPIVVEKIAGKWLLTSPAKCKADEPAVNTLLKSITDGKREKLIKEKDVDWKEFGFDQPELALTVRTKEKATKIVFGGPNPSKQSFYVRVGDNPELLLAADALKNAVNKSAFDLRDKSVVTISPEDVDRVVITAGEKQTEFSRDSAKKWVTAKPEKMRVKASAMESAVFGVAGLRAKKIIDLPAKEGDPYGLDRPEIDVTLSGDKLTQTLLIGKAVEAEPEKTKAGHDPSPDRYARVKDRDLVYVVEGRMIKNLPSDPEKIRDRSILALEPADVDKVEITLNGETWAMSRGAGTKWDLEQPEKREVDAWRASSLVWALKDLEWKSMDKAPENLAEVHLDKPGLVMSLAKKGEKDPIVFKAGWPAGEEKPQPTDDKPADASAPAASAEQTEAPTKQDKEKPPAAGDDKKGPERAESRIPETVHALVQPGEDKDAVYVLDGKFIKRLQEDLKNLTSKTP